MEKNSNNSKLKTLALVFCGVYSLVFIYNTFCDVWVPEYPKECGSQQDGIEPFTVNVSNSIVMELRSRLKVEVGRMKGEEEENELRKLAGFWLDNYNWKGKREKLINKYPQFRTKICGEYVHFQRIVGGLKRLDENGTEVKTRPLLLLHGIYRTFTEFHSLIPYLQNPVDSDINFELIIPSLPGYGFSEGSLGKVEMAHRLMELMKKIGHEKFYIHGSPGLGSTIGKHMASIYPHNVVGIHLTSCETRHPLAYLKDLAWTTLPAILTFNFQEFHRLTHFYTEDQPISSNSSLSIINSPTELANYFLKRDGNIKDLANKENFLDNLMIHLTNPNPNLLSGLETEFQDRELNYDLERVPIFVPASCVALESRDYDKFSPQSRYVIGDKFRNIIHFTDLQYTGNSPSTDIPDQMAKDIIKSFNWLEKRGFAFFEEYHRCQILPYESY